MTFKEIRKYTKMTQAEFSKRYQIPLDTIKGWESNNSSKRYRECPSYIISLFKELLDI